MAMGRSREPPRMLPLLPRRKALQYDPYSVKALYRRAAALRAVGSSAGLEAAVADLQAANALEPANAAVRLALTAAQHELRALRRKEHGLYGGMFRGDLYQDQRAAAAQGVPPAGTECGGTSPRCAGQQRQAPADPGDETWTEDEEEESGRSRERTLRASRAADDAVRGMQRSMAAARNRRMAAQLAARQRGRFAWWAVPWWAYCLIGLHLTYRLYRVRVRSMRTSHARVSSPNRRGSACIRWPERDPALSAPLRAGAVVGIARRRARACAPGAGASALRAVD
jgi:hypothetical protein